jgi:DNA sulfur modification protein DndD
MVIDSITLENYQVYYGRKTFEFKEGLNIVLGDNGEGKTAFIEAFEWLFSDQSIDLSLIVSAKKFSELEEGKSFQVSVSLVTKPEHDSIYFFERSFIVEKKSSEIIIGKSHLTATIENVIKGERQNIPGQENLESIFPTSVRKYSVFKGEEALNIFDQKDTLKELIDQFSTAKSYAKYQEYANYFGIEAQKELDKEISKNSKNQKAAEIILANIKDYQTRIKLISPQIERKLETQNQILRDIKRVESLTQNREEIDSLNKEIDRLKELRRTISIKEDYSNYLFDDKWILLHFGPVLDLFSEKIAKFSAEKREQEQSYMYEKGREQGAATSFLSSYKQLPIETPSKSIMEEMLQDEICKVCNREAKAGSEAYDFMYKKLQALIESTKPKLIDHKPLFPNKYVRKLENLNDDLSDSLLSINLIRNSIKDTAEFNESRRAQLDQIEEDLLKLDSRKVALIGNKGGDENKLNKIISDFTGWTRENFRLQREIDIARDEIVNFEKKINEENQKLESLGNSKEGANAKLKLTKNLLQDIFVIFKDTKNRKFEEFIRAVEKVANEKFSLINKNAFMGIIKININYIGERPEADIELKDKNQKHFRANKSLETSMNISILLAINEIVKRTKYHSYPLLMDAPVSSFAEDKKRELFESIFNLKNHQTIIFLKDFVSNQVITDDFKYIKRDNALWIKLTRPFDPENVATLETIIQKI